MLTTVDLRVAYDGVQALRGVSIEVGSGEIVALIGVNGAGKSTLLNTISGILRPKSGQILFGGPIESRSAPEVARLGLLQVPEGRQILPDLTVLENLQLGAIALGRREPQYSLDDVYALFPILSERRQQEAGSLSGGQQQMLAIGRALMGAPLLLMLDEPSLGLSPQMSKLVFDAIKVLNRRGTAVLLVEQNANLALRASTRAYVLDRGQIVHEGQSKELRSDPRIIAHYLGGKVG